METNVLPKRMYAGTVVASEYHWIGESNVRVRVRTIGNKENPIRVMLDLFEVSQEGNELAAEILNETAKNYAMAYGAANTHFLVIRDYVTARKVNDHLVRGESYTVLREKSYSFAGIGMY